MATTNTSHGDHQSLIRRLSDELQKEIDRVLQDPNYFGAVSLVVTFQSGKAKFVKAHSDRTVLIDS